MMTRYLGSISPLLFLLAPAAFAQTFTSCNPMNRTDCAANPALGTNATFNFTGATAANTNIWNTTAGSLKWADEGAQFVVTKRGDSPTVQTNFYIFWGVVTVMMRAASGQGIVSSIVLESDDLDEVDWELIGGNNTHVQTNYFGKGNTTSYDRSAWHPVSDPQSRFVNYTTHWTQEKLEWYVDGVLIRTLNYGNALGGYNYPQTPMNIRLGIWAGGDTENNSNGTIEWAGGKTDFTKGPFTMAIQSVYAQDFSIGKEYKWTDKSGSYSSIKAVEGTSAAQTVITKAAEPTGIKAKWDALPKMTKIGIIAGGASGLALLATLLLVCCIKQRRAGRREHARLESIYHKEAAEREAHRRREFGFDG